MCGALGIQAKRTSSYFEMRWPDSLKGWTSTCFYCEEPSTPVDDAAPPPYSSDLVAWYPSWGMKLTLEEAAQATMLEKRVAALSAAGLTRQDIITDWGQSVDRAPPKLIRPQH